MHLDRAWPYVKPPAIAGGSTKITFRGWWIESPCDRLIKPHVGKRYEPRLRRCFNGNCAFNQYRCPIVNYFYETTLNVKKIDMVVFVFQNF